MQSMSEPSPRATSALRVGSSGHDGVEAAASAKLPVTVIILAYNEELHLRRCLSRIAPWVERIVVVDSFSTDATIAIAESFGAEVLQHRFKNHADQFQWGLAAARVATPWVLRLDCDEYLEPGACDSLRRHLADLPDDVTGVTMQRKFIFKDRWIRHGRYYPMVLLRLWRNGCGEIEQRWMDEHIVLTRGRAIALKGGDLVDHNLNDIGWWIDKHNRYATRAMLDFLNREHPLFVEDRRVAASTGAARRNRFLKASVYGRAPLYLRASLLYLYRYILRLGFLDGKQGFLFHFMHGFWLFMLIDAKIDEARSFIAAHGVEAFKRDLAQRQGISL